ncbi:type II toxin-antitoxin system death-on-curing family toxin [Tsukamurella tyrosinosolvens]|uniref:type II toxin-antitoxin system death-on-curing family toxin n=1 Tax=Tsukamurella tyrosinosolvens TaxID=57704 RepID=UPI000DF69167|nr:type II toxin-antitoxin system death-on-curing family toxin [Tsukamurella tyrosinosolvens]MEC4613121.1 type II toxin-antitoxin system death-on-curing family toxin [Tsukamurella tyrosinosolvens]RDB46587.1 type II toxin-antitoxin system death-on-curing family toxin [Tsukamurella tyrosinosolvens]
MTVHLDLELLLTIIDQAGLPGVRDHGLLESAALRPQTSVFGDDAYPTLDEQAAALMESIVRNHPLVDGNKRLGWLATVVFYGLNGVPLDAPEDPAYDLVIAVAEGRIDYHASARLLASWTTSQWPHPIVKQVPLPGPRRAR